MPPLLFSQNVNICSVCILIASLGVLLCVRPAVTQEPLLRAGISCLLTLARHSCLSPLPCPALNGSYGSHWKPTLFYSFLQRGNPEPLFCTHTKPQEPGWGSVMTGPPTQHICKLSTNYLHFLCLDELIALKSSFSKGVGAGVKGTSLVLQVLPRKEERKIGIEPSRPIKQNEEISPWVGCFREHMLVWNWSGRLWSSETRISTFNSRKHSKQCRNPKKKDVS